MIFNEEVIELNFEDLKSIQDTVLKDKYDGKNVPLSVIKDESYNSMYAIALGWLDSRQSILFGLKEFLWHAYDYGKKFKDRQEAIKFIGDNFWKTGDCLDDYIYNHHRFEEYLEEIENDSKN